MKKSCYTGSQVSADIKTKCGDKDTSLMKRMQELEDENRRLKKMSAEE